MQIQLKPLELSDTEVLYDFFQEMPASENGKKMVRTDYQKKILQNGFKKNWILRITEICQKAMFQEQRL